MIGDPMAGQGKTEKLFSRYILQLSAKIKFAYIDIMQAQKNSTNQFAEMACNQDLVLHLGSQIAAQLVAIQTYAIPSAGREPNW